MVTSKLSLLPTLARADPILSSSTLSDVRDLRHFANHVLTSPPKLHGVAFLIMTTLIRLLSALHTLVSKPTSPRRHGHDSTPSYIILSILTPLWPGATEHAHHLAFALSSITSYNASSSFLSILARLRVSMTGSDASAQGEVEAGLLVMYVLGVTGSLAPTVSDIEGIPTLPSFVDEGVLKAGVCVVSFFVSLGVMYLGGEGFRREIDEGSRERERGRIDDGDNIV